MSSREEAELMELLKEVGVFVLLSRLLLHLNEE